MKTRFIATIFLCVFCFGVSAKQLLLNVSVKKQQFTEYSVPCKGESDDCISFFSWYVYHAKVLNVIKGNFEKKKIKFAVLQHSQYRKEYVKDVYVIVEEFENNETIEKLNTKYYSQGVIFPKKIICIDNNFIDSIESNSHFVDAYLVSKNGKEQCFFKEYLDSID